MIETLAYTALIASAVAVVATGINAALLYRKKRLGELHRPHDGPHPGAPEGSEKPHRPAHA